MEKTGGNAASKTNDAPATSLFILSVRTTTPSLLSGLSGSNERYHTVKIWQRKQCNTHSLVVLGKL